jgi:hypothetical protein
MRITKVIQAYERRAELLAFMTIVTVLAVLAIDFGEVPCRCSGFPSRTLSSQGIERQSKVGSET